MCMTAVVIGADGDPVFADTFGELSAALNSAPVYNHDMVPDGDHCLCFLNPGSTASLADMNWRWATGNDDTKFGVCAGVVFFPKIIRRGSRN